MSSTGAVKTVPTFAVQRLKLQLVIGVYIGHQTEIQTAGFKTIFIRIQAGCRGRLGINAAASLMREAQVVAKNTAFATEMSGSQALAIGAHTHTDRTPGNTRLPRNNLNHTAHCIWAIQG